MTIATNPIADTDVDELSEVSLARLRDRLISECARQKAQMKQHRATVDELTGQRDDDSVLEREIAEAAIDQTNDALIEIFHALVRLDAGTYGTCDHCGTAIPYERLEAIPHARLCVVCPTMPARLFG
ncbi:MAG: TraR/DksA C4-type zinc finger protein [Ilumatobacteraceae bacterium]